MHAKPLFILVMFILFIALMAGGAIGSTDLTPDTPPAEVVGISAAGAEGAPAMLYSPCGVSYTVLSGDTLSHIAQACGVSVADIVAANPLIQDPNKISPGQQLAIPGSAVQEAAAAPQDVAAPQEVAVVAAPTEAAAVEVQEEAADTEAAAGEAAAGEAPAVAEAAVADAAEAEAAEADLLPQGLVPGGIIHVTVKSLPPTTPVSLGIGKAGATPNMVEDRITNEKGELIIHIAIPKTAKPGEQWTVSVMTMTKPKTVVQSVPFTIQ